MVADVKTKETATGAYALLDMKAATANMRLMNVHHSLAIMEQLAMILLGDTHARVFQVFKVKHKL